MLLFWLWRSSSRSIFRIIYDIVIRERVVVVLHEIFKVTISMVPRSFFTAVMSIPMEILRQQERFRFYNCELGFTCSMVATCIVIYVFDICRIYFEHRTTKKGPKPKPMFIGCRKDSRVIVRFSLSLHIYFVSCEIILRRFFSLKQLQRYAPRDLQSSMR